MESDFDLFRLIRFWPENERDLVIERAAILEYDAGMKREDAERAAVRMVSENMGKGTQQRLF